MSIINKLLKRKLITPPKHLKNSTQYEVMMGSIAYGVSSDNSDIDIYGFSIPPKETIFTHLAGHIPGFGKKPNGFDQFQQHHILDKTDNKEYDIVIFNIVKFFQLCMINTPNMVDCLFVPQRCILHITKIGMMVRENRKLFLHKGSYHKFKGYAYGQLHKMNIKKPNPGSKRYDMVQQYGFDCKFAYHIVRLIDECEQILVKGDLDLENNKEQLKSIRRGEWKKEQIVEYFHMKEATLEKLYTTSKLQHGPDENKIKTLLINCLEQYYGSLNNILHKPNQLDNFINDIEGLIYSYTGRK